MVNESSDRDAGTGWRGVVQAVEITIGENMPTDHYYKLTPSTAGEYRTVRASHPDAHILGTGIGKIGPNNTGKGTIEGKYTYTADKIVGGVKRAQKGDIWHAVFEANGAPLVGWSAEIHMGVRYLTVEEIGTPPPPTGAPIVSIKIDAAPGTIVTTTYADGTVKTETA